MTFPQPAVYTCAVNTPTSDFAILRVLTLSPDFSQILLDSPAFSWGLTVSPIFPQTHISQNYMLLFHIQNLAVNEPLLSPISVRGSRFLKYSEIFYFLLHAYLSGLAAHIIVVQIGGWAYRNPIQRASTMAHHHSFTRTEKDENVSKTYRVASSSAHFSILEYRTSRFSYAFLDIIRMEDFICLVLWSSPK